MNTNQNFILPIFFCLFIACKPVISYHPNIVNGGRITTVSAHTRSDQIFIAAAETGGLFITNDQGNTWQHNSNLTEFAMQDVQFCPTESNVVITTCLVDTKVINGGGIWRSTDGGKTWNKPASSVTPITTRHKKRTSAYGVSFEPGTSTVIVGTDCGVAISKDLGVSWKHVIPTPYYGVWEDSLQDQIFCVLARGNGKMNAAGRNGIFYSTDSGDTWKSSTTAPWSIGSGLHRFAVSPYNPDHIFFTTDNRTSRTDPVNTSVIYKSLLTYLSTDGGITWDTIKVPEEGYGRETFIKTAKSISGKDREFDLYYGTGFNTYRQTCRDGGSGPTLTYTWTMLQMNHSDPSDMAFDPNNSIPVLLSGDGGMLKTTDKGKSWTMAGGGDKGLNALQITEVNGHQVAYASATDREPNFHTDLYFGTQDNYVWASPDEGITWPNANGGEGFYIQPEGRKLLVTDEARVVFVSCSDCDNIISGAYFAGAKSWRNPLDVLENNPRYLQTPGHYVQNLFTTYYDGFIKANTFYITASYGSAWTARTVIPYILAGHPRVSKSPQGPVVYQAISRPGKTASGFGNIGLIRVKNIEGSNQPIIYDADISNFGSLGVFATMFAWYVVYEVDPHDADHVIIADIGTNQMKYTIDGGKCWHVDDQLTKLVTGNGKYRFHDGVSLMQAHFISFDPDHEGRIIVGTQEAGIICSQNNGNSWETIPNSEQITNASSGFFDFENAVMVSSYGRGLWKIRLSKAKPAVKKETPSRCPVPKFYDKVLADKIKWEDYSDIPGCNGCMTILNHGGVINDLVLDREGVVREIKISADMAMASDTSLIEKPVEDIRVSVSGTVGNFGGDAKAKRILESGEKIRGIVLQDNKLKGYITSENDIPAYADILLKDSIVEPYIFIDGKNMFNGLPGTSPGDELEISGINFSSLKDLPLIVMVDSDTLAVRITSDSLDRFLFRLPASSQLGIHKVSVSQEVAGREKIRVAGYYTVQSNDRKRGD